MKIVVFGANGGTGVEVVKQALAVGHRVTAVVRRPESITIQHQNLCVWQGDVLDANAVEVTIAGQDAVISALGIKVDAPTVIYSEGVTNMMRTMKTSGVRRLLCVSASGLDPGPVLQQWIAKPLLWRFFKNNYTDLARMETLIKASDLDWTIVRPPMFSNKPRTGRYQIAINRQLRRGYTISRADTADFIVTHLDKSPSYRAIVEIAY
ncbi:MAG: SDR family oxidoreductase [Anaerolineae bacterium]|nr:SDR family oxidoreductase [Anaerolineae bacterium]